jgi:hypothetical protein
MNPNGYAPIKSVSTPTIAPSWKLQRKFQLKKKIAATTGHIKTKRDKQNRLGNDLSPQSLLSADNATLYNKKALP